MMRAPAAAADLGFDDIREGDVFEIARTFTAADVDAFAALSGDFSPLHVDAAYAAETEFGRRVVHGMLLASLFSTLVGMRIPGRPALYLGQDLAFRRPVFIGDALTARAKVTGKNAATATLSLAMEIRDAEGRVAVAGSGRVKVRGAVIADKPQPAGAAAKTRSDAPVAIVTGGVRGLGGAIARRLAATGHHVVAVYRTNDRAAHAFADDVAAQGGLCRIVKADVTDDAGIAAVLEGAALAGGPTRVLVNAAVGSLEPIAATELDWASVDAHFLTQVKAVLALCQGVHPLMKAAGGGAIVNLLSQVVSNVPPKGMAHYVAAKYALMGLSKSLAAEWASDRIRVNMVSPGLARTELTQHTPDRTFKMEAVRTPLGRLVEAADVAAAVSYLAGEDAAFVTGINILLTGGQDMPS